MLPKPGLPPSLAVYTRLRSAQCSCRSSSADVQGDPGVASASRPCATRGAKTPVPVPLVIVLPTWQGAWCNRGSMQQPLRSGFKTCACNYGAAQCVVPAAFWHFLSTSYECAVASAWFSRLACCSGLSVARGSLAACHVA
jgi:hypothetical protein